MQEIWTPPHDRLPDAANIFDAMHLFQETIDEIEEAKAKIERAQFAVNAIGRVIREDITSYSDFTIHTNFVFLPGSEGGQGSVISSEVGMTGILSDIQCIELNQQIPISMMVSLDAITIHPSGSPDDSTVLMRNAKIPIANIRSIVPHNVEDLSNYS